MIKKRRHEKLRDCFSRFALQWFEHLATGRYDEAARMLDGQDSIGYPWGEDEIRHALADAPGLGGSRITPPSETDGAPTNVFVYPTMEGLGYHFDHPLPIDGEWSELIVRFLLERTPDGYKCGVEDIEEAD